MRATNVPVRANWRARARRRSARLPSSATGVRPKSASQSAVTTTLNSAEITSARIAGQPAQPSDYNSTTVNLGARYNTMEDHLRFTGLIGPTFGDFKRTIFDAGAEYMLIKSVWLVSNLSVMQIPDITNPSTGTVTPSSSDVIWSLILRYNM